MKSKKSAVFICSRNIFTIKRREPEWQRSTTCSFRSLDLIMQEYRFIDISRFDNAGISIYRFDNAGISTPHRSLSEVGPKSVGDAAVTRAIEMRATLWKRMIM